MAINRSIFAFLFFLIVGYAAASCDVTSAQGKKYDLSAFSKNSPVQIKDSTNSIDFSFCGVSNAVMECTEKESAFCVYRDNVFLYNVATWRSSSDIKSAETLDNGLKLTFSNSRHDIIGDLTMVVTITCASSATVPIATRTAGTPYTFELAFSHPAGCGGSGGGNSGGLSGGWIFIIILLCVAFTYTVVGCLINWRVRGRSLGKDACPNAALWMSIPGLVKDGALFTVAKIKGCCGGGRGKSMSEGGDGENYETL